MFKEKNSTLVEDVKERTATREGKKEEDTDKKTSYTDDGDRYLFTGLV